MSEYTDQLAVIFAETDSVTDVGVVHDHPRFYEDALAQWEASVDGHSVIRAWEIGVAGETFTDRLYQGSRSRFRPWRIQGYLGPIDVVDEDPGDTGITPGYTAALDIAELIANEIEGNRTLDGTCLDIASPDEQIGTNITEPVLLRIPGPLCWGIGIEFWTWTHVA